MSWSRRVRLRHYLRTNLWVVPALSVVAALMLSAVTPSLDDAVADLVGNVLSAETARTSLSAISSGMIAFTGFVFSGTLVVVQFGTTAFSPRAVRVLRQDRVLKAALGTFTATFIYALATLVNVGQDESGKYVPLISWFFTFLLLLGSVGVFFALVQRLMTIMTVAGLARRIGRRGRRAARRLPTGVSEAGGAVASDASGEVTQMIRHRGEPGVLVAIDAARLRSLASRARARVSVVPQIGDAVAEGSALFEVHGGERQLRPRAARRALVISEERTIDHDPAFALRLLVDIADKALSASINDPTSAVQVIDQLDALLRAIARRSLGPRELADRSGIVRVSWPMPRWEDHLSLAVEEIRVYGSDDPQVARRLRAMLEDLRDDVPERRRPAVERELERLDEHVVDAFALAGDLAVARRADRQGIGAGGPPR